MGSQLTMSNPLAPGKPMGAGKPLAPGMPNMFNRAAWEEEERRKRRIAQLNQNAKGGTTWMGNAIAPNAAGVDEVFYGGGSSGVEFGGDTAGGGLGQNYTMDGYVGSGTRTTDLPPGGRSGLDEFYGKQSTSWVKDHPGGVRRMAGGTDGDPLPPFQPFIAGDPQADGQPNEELIIPGPDGIHVVPLRELPKMAYGTTNDLGPLWRMDVDVPGRGRVSDARRIAMDDLGNIVGAASEARPVLPEFGGQRPEAEEAERRMALRRLLMESGSGLSEHQYVGATTLLNEGAPVEEVRAKASQAWQHNQAEARRKAQAERQKTEWQERQRVGNPEGIVVGVTPRAALKPLEPFGGPVSDEERQYERMERLVMNQARRDPRLALGLLNARAGAEADRQAARARMVLEQFQQGEMNARNQAGIDATNARATATGKATADAQAVANNFKLADESRKAAEMAQKFVRPEVNVEQIPGTDYVIPFAGNRAMGTLPARASQEMEPMETFPGSGEYMQTRGGKPLPEFGTATMTEPGTPGFEFRGTNLFGGLGLPAMKFPATAPKFKQNPKGAEAKEKAPDLLKEIKDLTAAARDTTDKVLLDRYNRRIVRLLKEYDPDGEEPEPTPVAAVAAGARATGAAPTAPAAPASVSAIEAMRARRIAAEKK